MADTTFFKGKVVLVTGSSNGIGRETARMFAERGAKVTITGRNADTLRETRDLCIKSGANKEDLLGIIGDIEAEGTPQKLGRRDTQKIRANRCSGRSTTPESPWPIRTAACSARQLSYSTKPTTRSVILLTNLAAAHLEKTKGAVVNVSSLAGQPFGQQAWHYSISKAALVQLTVLLATELMKKGIRVNSVNPGLCGSDIHRKSGLPEEIQHALYAATANENTANVPLGRLGTPADVAKLIVFLADRSQSEYIVGQRIVIDGGTVLKNNLLSFGYDK